MTADLRIAALIILAAAVWIGFLYLSPFGRCPKCRGTGTIQRGKRRPVCPKCKGQRRIQRGGSRTVHRTVFRIRDGQRTAARYQQEERDV